jgi:hypothetical protein
MDKVQKPGDSEFWVNDRWLLEFGRPRSLALTARGEPRQKEVTLFWDVTPCDLVELFSCFGGRYSLHYQGERACQAQ